MELMRLASSVLSHQARFDDIYLGVAKLFENQADGLAQSERELAADILKRLTKDVEMSIRIGLAERLASDPSAPLDLLVLLVDDKIEVAKPILARSPVLSDNDLVHVVESGSPDHQVVVAERPNIGVTVSSALARRACEAAIIALLRNNTAKISQETFVSLGETAKRTPSLQEPLVGRKDLPTEFANSLYSWVSAGLKTALSGRYPGIARPISSVIDETVQSIQADQLPMDEASARKLVVGCCRFS